jgi:glyoxylase-like metal-dependent hydrolase (beta-lactamase superfamily II)
VWQCLSAPGGPVFAFPDSCWVYAICREGDALLIDSGQGAWRDHLSAIGARRVTHVLHTHHHRDQCQADRELAREGAAIWVPEWEQELWTDVESLWSRRDLANSYSGL